MRIPDNVLGDLIELGRSGEERVPSSLADANHAWRMLINGHEPWAEAAASIGDEQLINLIRGLVLYSRAAASTLGGSVSPVVYLYHCVVERAPDLEPPLTKWVVAHRTNPYEPFGSPYARDADYASYSARKGASLIRARISEEQEAERQRQRADARQERDRTEATQRIANAVRRGDLRAVKALLDKGADTTKAVAEGGSLLGLAEQNGRDAVAAFLRERGIA